MSSWRMVAADVMARTGDAVPPPEDDFDLPVELAISLRRLQMLAPSRNLEDCSQWRSVVADATMLARDRWAAKAMALGWTVSDLFGIGPRDDWDFQGLAVWLNGRDIIMLDATHAIARDGAQDCRYVFVRGGMRHGIHPAVTPIMIWDFGR